jgi:hypothetical protein
MNRTPPKNGRICADHFSEDQWEIYGKVLKKHAAPSIFGFPKFSLNSNIEEKMCAALPDNLNQFNSYLRTKCGKTMFPHERFF